MLTQEQAREMTGHAVGGVCPFAVNEDCDVYLDESLRRFDVVVPGLRQLQQRHRPRSRRAGQACSPAHLGRRLQVARRKLWRRIPMPFDIQAPRDTAAWVR